MCYICSDFKAKRITAEQAYKLINKTLARNTTAKEQAHLIALSDLIMDSDVPFKETNQEADEIWWKATHGHGGEEG